MHTVRCVGEGGVRKIYSGVVRLIDVVSRGEGRGERFPPKLFVGDPAKVLPPDGEVAM